MSEETKSLAEFVRETRENIGISIEEAAEDLKIKPSQIEEVEEGNIKAFKDVFSLKYFVRDYAKYLGLDYNDMVDEFNEYLFDYTSRLSLDEIKKAQKEDEKDKEEPKIISPYTLEKKRKKIIPPAIIWVIILMIVGIVAYFIVDAVIDDNHNNVVNNSVLE